MTRRRTAQSSRRRPRAWLALYLLLAFVWPSIGPLPWLIDFAAEEVHAGSHAHHDASEIPGSPTHPDDHDCFQCEVIKHLARCVPSEGSYPTVALVTSRPPQPSIQVRSNYRAFALPRPPIRGPPPLHG